MELLSLVEQLESFVSTSAGVPLTSRTLVDTRKLRELVEQLRLAVPESIREAGEILKQKENILAQARVEARCIRSAAEEEARRLVDTNQLVEKAKEQATSLVEEAQRKAQRVLEHADTEVRTRRNEVDTYARQKLEKLEKELTAILTLVRRGLENLEQEG